MGVECRCVRVECDASECDAWVSDADPSLGVASARVRRVGTPPTARAAWRASVDTRGGWWEGLGHHGAAAALTLSVGDGGSGGGRAAQG